MKVSREHVHRRMLWGVALAALAFQGDAAASGGKTVLGDNVQARCTQPLPEMLECDYRFLRPAPVLGVTAFLNEVEIPSQAVVSAARSEAVHAVLLLVDTSDEGRQPAIERIGGQIGHLLAGARDYHHFGLGVFSSDLQILAPLGTPADEVTAKAAELAAVDRATELYRSTLESIYLLQRYPARRRAIFLFSDGLADDKAYYLQDVLTAARQAGVVIFGLGYRRSESLAVGLQTLRRLSEETGGVFVAAGAGLNLPSQFLEDPFHALDNGGRVTIDMTSAAFAIEPGKSHSVRIVWSTERGPAAFGVPVDLTPSIAPGTGQPAVFQSQAAPVREPAVKLAAENVRPLSRKAGDQTPASGTDDDSLWLLAVVAVGILVLATGRRLLMRGAEWLKKRFRSTAGKKLRRIGKALVRNKSFQRDDRGSSEDAAEAAGYLERLDRTGGRFPVTGPTFRIGRHSDNELTLQDPSVSRRHAEIQRRHDGSFVVRDLDSMNGLYVNGKQVSSAYLSHGDLIELGDIQLAFGIEGVDATDQQKTVALKTTLRR